MNSAQFLACLLLLPVAACTRSSAPLEAHNAPSASPFSGEPSPRSYASTPSSEGDVAAPAPAPSQRAGSSDGATASAPRAARAGSGSAYQPPAEKKAEDRPGLGTT